MRCVSAGRPLNTGSIKAAALWLALAVVAGSAQVCLAADGEPVEAQFRGCEAAGWCRFWVAPQDAIAQPLLRVRPAGVLPPSGDPAVSIALRDRFTTLLVNMIHQDKRIMLNGLRPLADGTFAATVTVNGADVALDPTVVDLQHPAENARR
jgi:hypothetical protein